MEDLWQPCFKQVYRCHFSKSIGSLRDSVSHFGYSWETSDAGEDHLTEAVALRNPSNLQWWVGKSHGINTPTWWSFLPPSSHHLLVFSFDQTHPRARERAGDPLISSIMVDLLGLRAPWKGKKVELDGQTENLQHNFSPCACMVQCLSQLSCDFVEGRHMLLGLWSWGSTQ